MIPARRSGCQRLTEVCRSAREFTTTAHHRRYPLKAALTRTKTPATVAIRHYRPSRPRHHVEAPSIGNGPLSKIAQGLQQTIKATTVGGNLLLRQMTKPSVLPFSGQATTWEDAVSEAQGLVLNDKEQRLIDPVKLLGPDLWELKGNVARLLEAGHPFLSTLMTHFLCEDGRQVRPLTMLLMALSTSKQDILPTQRRLAEITQMIHTASLLHDDVLDGDANTSNKLAILAGDFLLARASLALAYLRNPECVEVMATCIADSVEGEFMHLSANEPIDFDVLMQGYMKKAYMRTASLMAHSCKASAVLGGLCTTSDEAQAAYDFGKHFGIAHQVRRTLKKRTCEYSPRIDEMTHVR